jgi:two-component system cell cycle response regulator
VARIGGEEFLVILPDVDIGMVGTIAGRLCTVIADEPMVCTPEGTRITVTTSVGVTLAGEAAEPVDAVLKRADTALYRAKNAGRNRVETELAPV